jgi:hypothetical protein
MEHIIVLLIVAFAVGFLGRHFYQKYIQKNQCSSSGCSACPTDVTSCDLPEAREYHLTQPAEIKKSELINRESTKERKHEKS